MLFFPDLIGNDSLKERLGTEILDASFSHAYILDGPSGSGKHTLALQIAAALSCTDPDKSLPCGCCDSCRKILSGKSPDVLWIKKEDRASLGVEAIRKIRSDLYISPNELSQKIYILEDAETMTVQAQNAFLLSLESPPPYVLFLLLVQGSENLLETIRSRAPVLRMQPIPAPDILSFLRSKGHVTIGDEELNDIVLSSDGRIGEALNLCNSKQRSPVLKRRRFVKDFLASCVRGSSKAARIQLLLSLGHKREDYLSFVEDTYLAARDLLFLKKSRLDTDLCFFSRKEAETLAVSFSSQYLLSLLSCLEESRTLLQKNANVRLISTKILLCSLGEPS